MDNLNEILEKIKSMSDFASKKISLGNIKKLISEMSKSYLESEAKVCFSTRELETIDMIEGYKLSKHLVVVLKIPSVEYVSKNTSFFEKVYVFNEVLKVIKSAVDKNSDFTIKCFMFDCSKSVNNLFLDKITGVWFYVFIFDKKSTVENVENLSVTIDSEDKKKIVDRIDYDFKNFFDINNGSRVKDVMNAIKYFVDYHFSLSRWTGTFFIDNLYKVWTNKFLETKLINNLDNKWIKYYVEVVPNVVFDFGVNLNFSLHSKCEFTYRDSYQTNLLPFAIRYFIYRMVNCLKEFTNERISAKGLSFIFDRITSFKFLDIDITVCMFLFNDQLFGKNYKVEIW